MVAGLVAYPFLLRPGLWVHLRLPADITRAEIEHIADWLMFMISERDDTPRCSHCGSSAWVYHGDRQQCADCNQ